MRPNLPPVYVPPELRYLVFPPGFIYRDPTSSSKPSRHRSQSESINIVPHRPSHQHSQPESIKIVPHDKFQGLYVCNCDDGNTLYTKNLVPSQAPLYDDEVIISVKDNDGTLVEYREWNPFYSKLAAAILCGAQNLWIKPGSRVLVIYSGDDHRFGTTISHISDLVGPRDVLFAAPDSEEEVRMSYLAAKYFLETGGHYMLYFKADGIESTSRGDSVFSSLAKHKQIEFKRMEQVSLEPFDKDHAYIIGAFRTLKVDEVEPSCLETNKFLTAEYSHRRDHGEYISLFEQQKNLPVYILFDSSCGYALFRAHKVYSVERNYIAIEEYINRFDEFYEFRACHPFESANDALSYLNSVSDGTVHEQLIEFLLLNLPKPVQDGGKDSYSLAVPTDMMANHIVEKTKIPCSINLFHDEIIRGVRMHIDRFFKDLKPGDLEKAQLDLTRNYCRQKLDSSYNGKSQKKRSSFQASIPSSISSRKIRKRRCL
ncbi:NOP5NT domain-containing protein [Heracleum sosnowskyi]|uniref:NOP5NT domain-containing protein n=1 Tax=Heracleum sosnowskyi TaxID=360622 RepID=A0AAD8H1R7_9APIA|nr:NOP5NT domain-containing protein [Heracleum sosnowskyi]